MIDLSLAFSGDFVGLSIWLTPAGEFQCNLKRRNGAFAIGIGETIQDAWDAAWRNSGSKPKPIHRRDVEDLA